jgi:hypothetical protein
MIFQNDIDVTVLKTNKSFNRKHLSFFISWIILGQSLVQKIGIFKIAPKVGFENDFAHSGIFSRISE